jgi:hypothetical protein
MKQFVIVFNGMRRPSSKTVKADHYEIRDIPLLGKQDVCFYIDPYDSPVYSESVYDVKRIIEVEFSQVIP